MKDIDKKLKAWNALISDNRKLLNISDLDFSALSSWGIDCNHSFNRIYSSLLSRVEACEPEDVETLHECVSEIYFDLKHIQEHIEAAEKGFLDLMRVLSEKADK